MLIYEFQDIINFAVAREQESVDFYRDLATKVGDPAILTELDTIAAMEEEHRDRLRALDVTQAFGKPVEGEKKTLRIADYMVSVLPAPDMSFGDLLSIAMQREQASVNLYSDLAAEAGNTTARQLFEKLTSEEVMHKLFFEKIWDSEVYQED